MIPEELIQQVRDANDIVDVVSNYVTLKKRGKSHTGLCPFHSEKSPSFSVVQDKQFFHCFGCHTGGDVIKFIMDIEGFTYIEAVKHLANQAGILLPEVEDNQDSEETIKLERMKEAHSLSAKLYHHVLIQTKYGENAREYLKNRGLSNETIQKFLIGYAPADRQFLTEFLQRRGFNLDEMVEAGLLNKDDKQQYFDRFSDRVQFPIEDLQGRIVAFSGRTLGEGKPKYLNSPESPIFHKSKTLFNFANAKKHIRKSGQVILLEGHLDTISLVQAGFHNAVASQGTAFNDEMARILRRYANTVTICYDSDEAGLSAAEKAADLFIAAGVDVRVATLPDGMDPDDYIRKNGGESFRVQILKNVMPITAFRLERLRKGKNLSDSIEQRRYVEKALDHIANLTSAIERDHYIMMLSNEFHIPAEVLRQEVKKLFHKQKQRNQSRDMATNKWNTNINNGDRSADRSLKPAYFNAERKLLALMLKDKELINTVMEDIGGAFNEPDHVMIAAEIYACYSENVPSIATAVLHRLPDPNLQNIVTNLIMDEMDEPITDKLVRGLIQSILDYPRQKELEELILARQHALEIDDFQQFKNIDGKITELQKQLKSHRYNVQKH